MPLMVNLELVHSINWTEEIGQRIRDIRVARGWSRTELCHQLEEVGFNMSTSTLHKLERYHPSGSYVSISVKTLKALSQALEVCPLDFIEGD